MEHQLSTFIFPGLKFTMRSSLASISYLLLFQEVQGQSISGFTLFDANEDVELRSIVEGDRIEISTAVNIRADTVGDIDHVILSLDEGLVTRTENEE
jgi:hypothetical protein